jgi:hypothetical protein
MPKTIAGERRKAPKRDARELARDARALQKNARAPAARTWGKGCKERRIWRGPRPKAPG